FERDGKTKRWGTKEPPFPPEMEKRFRKGLEKLKAQEVDSTPYLLYVSLVKIDSSKGETKLVLEWLEDGSHAQGLIIEEEYGKDARIVEKYPVCPAVGDQLDEIFPVKPRLFDVTVRKANSTRKDSERWSKWLEDPKLSTMPPIYIAVPRKGVSTRIAVYTKEGKTSNFVNLFVAFDQLQEDR
ncbi:MAG: hypothetical protein QGD94_04600, partial [Planctomycetia bacterium]|nr:hypothetical protein [Planctomycetia bacterium]